MILASQIEKMQTTQGKRQEEEYRTQVSDLCRLRLLGYAESFKELARSFAGEFEVGKEDRQSLLEDRRVWENRQVICSNLSEVASIMNRVATEEFRYLPMEEKKKKLLTRAFKDEGLHAEGICYIPGEEGQKAIGMTLSTEKKGGRPAAEVADMLTVLLERQMQVSALSPYLVDEKARSFVFVEEASYIVLTGFAKVVKENETVSGDNYSFLEAENGKMTILLSDGTGSGEKAGKDSERVLDLMEKMLEAGFSLESAVKLVNSALFARNEDSNHPTLDICSFDLHRGGCDICKVGGATTFLKRERQVEQIAFQNLPLGIFQNIEPQIEHRSLRDGDYLIMMSDGVLDAFGEQNYEEAMEEAISMLTEQNPGEIAEKLLHLALLASGGHIYDDMTIIVAGVWENSSRKA